MINKTRLALVIAAALTTAACGSDTKEVEIDNTKNSAPSISGTAPAAMENVAFTYSASATDAENDTLTYSATGLPEGCTINAESGEITGTIMSAGSYPFTVSVSDGEATSSINLTLVVETAPLAPSSPDAPALVLAATENEEISLVLTGTDPDGDAVTVTLDDPSALPSWATYYADTNIIVGTPDYNDATDADEVLALTATDSNDNTTAGTLTLSVANVNQLPYVSSSKNCDTTNAQDELTSVYQVCRSNLNMAVYDRDGVTPTVTNVMIKDADGNEALVGWTYDGQAITPADSALPLYETVDGVTSYAAAADYTFSFDANDGEETVPLSFTLKIKQHTDSGDYDLDGIKNGIDATPEDGSDISIDIIGRGHENLAANIAYVDDIVEASIDSDPETNTYTPTITHLSSNDGGACVALSGYAAPVCQSADTSAKTSTGTSYSKAGLLDMAAAQSDITDLTVGDNHACWKADGEMTCSTFKGELVSTAAGVHTDYNEFVFYNNYSDGAGNDLHASGSDTYCTAKSADTLGLNSSGGSKVVCDGAMSGEIDIDNDFSDGTNYIIHFIRGLAITDNEVCYNIAQYTGTESGGVFIQSPVCHTYENGDFEESTTQLLTTEGLGTDFAANTITNIDGSYEVMDAEGANVCLAHSVKNTVFCNNEDLATSLNGDDTYQYTQLAVGDAHVCGLTTNDTVECWGDDTYGQVSDMPTLVNPTQVTSSNDFSCALDDEGVKCWGAVANVSDLSAGN